MLVTQSVSLLSLPLFYGKAAPSPSSPLSFEMPNVYFSFSSHLALSFYHIFDDAIAS